MGVGNFPKVFYTVTTWQGIEPRICNTLVRRSTSKPPSLVIKELQSLKICTVVPFMVF